MPNFKSLTSVSSCNTSSRRWLENISASTVGQAWLQICFNPRAPAGRDAASPTRSATSTSFNPRAPAGRDPLGRIIRTDAEKFQSTRPGGARREEQRVLRPDRIVSIHAPRRGATLVGFELGHHRHVSIHAPRRGATSRLRCLWPCRGVSIHAPRRGATAVGERPAGAFGVSIHAPRRGATSALLPRRHPVCVSIHAPRRGATRHDQRQRAVRRVSIHAPRRGATITHVGAADAAGTFQSTRPGGARLDQVLAAWNTATVSIHAPRRGATPPDVGDPRTQFVSIHAPRRGATRPLMPSTWSLVFQSTRPGGARRGFGARGVRHNRFNPRAPAGRDSPRAEIHLDQACFNPRAPAGRDMPQRSMR